MRTRVKRLVLLDRDRTGIRGINGVIRQYRGWEVSGQRGDNGLSYIVLNRYQRGGWQQVLVELPEVWTLRTLLRTLRRKVKS